MIIAEIGLNHMGSLNLLKKYIRKLNQSDVDAITVQIVSKNLFKQYNINKQYFINEKVIYKTVFKESKKKIGLIIDKVTHDTKKYSKKISFFKILGDQVNDSELLKSINKFKKKIFISNKNQKKKGQKKLNALCRKHKNIFLIHTQGYKKSDPKYSNLFNINKINNATNKKTSFGLHCVDLNIAYLSLLFNPLNLFFYIKGNKKLKYPDNEYAIHLHSLEKFVKQIKKLKNSIDFWK
jgi:sialic acid synthase SpsE